MISIMTECQLLCCNSIEPNCNYRLAKMRNDIPGWNLREPR